jgi:hypothetical protein
MSRRYSLVRLAIMLAGIAASYLAFSLAGDLAGWIAVALFIAAFAVIAHFHSRIERSIRLHRIWLHIKRGHLARMVHDWPNIPQALDPTPEPDHPFEVDLNLTGDRSLHHLIDTAVSTEGSRRLRSWLVERRIDPARTLERQALVRELRPLSIFRDRLALNGALMSRSPGERWEGEGVMNWLQEHEEERALKPYLILLAALAAINLAFIALEVFDVVHGIWPITLLVYAAFYLFRRKEFAHLFEDAFDLELRLGQLRGVLLYLESYDYRRTPHLARLCEPFRNEERRPSAQLRAVARIANAASFQHNPVTRLLLNIVVPWDYYFADRLTLVKERIQHELPLWLDRWHELEALSSLANFSDLNPGYAFPELIAGDRPIGSEGRLFDAVDAGHPLLPDDARVTNSYSIERPGEIAIVTGSNMSGKSTFLRTLGVNLCLAYAGAPVCASAFRPVPFRLFTGINVSDSVNDGISYFYAEVRRLKELLVALEADHPFPLFFLIDEIFRGTNNRERLIGSRSFVRALAGGHGAGLISTHDLELVQIADEVPGITNYHFREHITDGRMVFDYLLRREMRWDKTARYRQRS